MPKQLHIFIDNTPGRLEAVTGKLLKHGLNIMTFTIQDRGDYGLVKLLVNEPDKACHVLADMGSACALKDVLAISVADKTGNLHALMTTLAQNGINVLDAHGFVVQPGRQGICILEIEQTAMTRADTLVRNAGFATLDDAQLRDVLS